MHKEGRQSAAWTINICIYYNFLYLYFKFNEKVNCDTGTGFSILCSSCRLWSLEGKKMHQTALPKENSEESGTVWVGEHSFEENSQ